MNSTIPPVIGMQNSISPSSFTESRLDLTGVDMKQLTQNLNSASATNQWSKYTAMNTEQSWEQLLPLVVSAVSSEVGSNDELKQKVIEPLSMWKAAGLLSSSSQGKVEGWNTEGCGKR